MARMSTSELPAFPVPASPAAPGSQRLMSLDALRGFDMFCIIGADSLVYALHRMAQAGGHAGTGFSLTGFLAGQLEHADWVGFHFYDLIFALFVFMAGISIVFSLGRTIRQQGRAAALKRVCRRSLLLFLLALFFSPLIDMIGSYRPITAPALVVVGAMMMRGVAQIDWDNYAESLPAFLVIAGIPLTFSIADGLALGFIAYPAIKLLAGQGRDVKWLMYVMAVVLAAYFIMIRTHAGVA